MEGKAIQDQTIWTPAADEKLRKYLNRDGYEIPAGLGTKESACSMAAINLALSGELVDSPPGCMSSVVGHWIVVVQDDIPALIRNSAEWRELLPLAAGTGREREVERLDMTLDWMWGTVLPVLQPIADADGYGDVWRAMCEQRTYDTANAAWDASAASINIRDISIASIASVASIARASAWDAGLAGDAAIAASAAGFAIAADSYNPTGSDPEHWRWLWASFNPIGLLRRLVEIRS